ncbi:MAG: hypothetical protein GY696_26380 [Gammaproteobacteria bacterium]|nr:hypothetical protein [Gammaproteobacteria bacterium]
MMTQYVNDPRPKYKPPSDLIMHLCAGNISTLITSVFLTRMELFNLDEYLQSPEELFHIGLAWSVLGSILLPWQAFYRYYSIICLAEVKKAVE